MSRDIVSFELDTEAAEAARAFERYSLLSAPVVDEQKRLQGRLSVDAILEYVRQESSEDILTEAGLLEEEDLFASVWKSAHNRWFWLGINLVTAVISTRAIGFFEDTIGKVVVLASLMPIVAGIGGNTGTQTSTLIIRSLALGMINTGNVRRLIIKEIGIGLLNGTVWGTLIGSLVWLVYRDPSLAGVMAAAMLINLMIAALMGLTIPLVRWRLDMDPALGTSVLLTAVTDGMGFFVFLGLATLFLV